MNMKPILILCMLFFFAVSSLISQETNIIERGQPSRYFIGKEETMLLPVNILGLVKKPGQYLVPFGTNLISLIAYAGGFAEDAKINDIKIIRHMQKNGGNNRKAIVFKVNIKRYFETGDPRQIPRLMPDDTIRVSGTRTRTLNKVFAWVGRLLPLAQLYFYIKIAAKR